jgi:hypothetical protein
MHVLCITTALVIVKTNLVTEICDKILRFEFIEAFILETMEICMKGVTSGRAMSHVNMSPEIGHWYAGGTQEQCVRS